jgi:hypothetical protein
MTRNKRLTLSLAAAGLFLAAAVALKLAEKAGLVSHELAVRLLQVFTGLALAVYANFIPKSLKAFRDPAAAYRAQASLRVAGWSFTLGGLGYALASALPIPDTVALAILGTATAYVLGYVAWAVVTCPPPEGGSASQS